MSKLELEFCHSAAKHLEIEFTPLLRNRANWLITQSEMKPKHTTCWWDHDQVLLFCSNKSDSGRGSLIKFKLCFIFYFFAFQLARG